MPIVHECAAEECHILTMGDLCLEHELLAAADSLAADEPVAAERDVALQVASA